MTIKTERIPFRLIIMRDCCGAVLCHVNHRFPNFCPECGERCFGTVKGNVCNSDMNAILTYDFQEGE